MRIGHDENFLSIEVLPTFAGHAQCKLEAVAEVSGRRFTASHDALLMDTGDATRKGFEEFANLRSHHVQIALSEGGWLRFDRDARGWITVQYRVRAWKLAAAMEGDVIVEGEFTGNLCREFAELLRAQNA